MATPGVNPGATFIFDGETIPRGQLRDGAIKAQAARGETKSAPRGPDFIFIK